MNPSLLLIPDRYKAAKLYSQIPNSGDGDLTVTRDTTAYRTNASGLLESVASGVARLDYTGGGCPSLLIEPAATNLALHSRDLTDIVWVKLNVTAAKTAIGADGVASGATTLTASAASGTVLQTITSASSARIFSAYVRRRTGTGAVQITQDNGTTWTTITLTSVYQRFSSPIGTITNPVFGFRILTSGDQIDVDFTQQETGSVATSAIPTVAATVTRNADVITKTGVSGLIGQTQGTLYFEVLINSLFDAGGAGPSGIEIGDGGSFANILSIGLVRATPNEIRMTNRSSSANISRNVFNLSSPGIYKCAVGYSSLGSSFYVNGNLISNFITGTQSTPILISSFNRITLGGAWFGAAPISQNNQLISAAAIYTTRLSNSELAQLTTL